MEVNCHLVKTGHRYSVVRARIKQSIRRLTKYRREFYIGKTNNPKMRARSRDPKWNEMVVLYKTTSADRVGRMERDLIEHFADECCNGSWGGEGPTAESGPYFIYILR